MRVSSAIWAEAIPMHICRQIKQAGPPSVYSLAEGWRRAPIGLHSTAHGSYLILTHIMGAANI